MQSSNGNNGNNGNGEPIAEDQSVVGAVRVSVSRTGRAPVTPEEQPQEQQPAGNRHVRIGGNALSINSRGEQKNLGTTRVVVGGAADPSGASGILATARSPVFHGPVAQINEKTIVTIPGEDGGPGYDVPVRVALSMGYLVKNGDTYTETTKAQRDAAEAAKYAAAEAQQKAEQEQSSNSGDVNQMTATAFHPEIEKDLDQITQGRGADVWGPVFAGYLLDHQNLDRVVGSLEMSRAQAQAFVGVAEAAFSAQARAALGEIVGDDIDGFGEWVQQNKPAEYKRAVANHLHARSTDAYRQLANEYLRTVAPSEAMLARSGYEVAKDSGTGELLVKLEGEGWVSVKSATRRGAFVLPRGYVDGGEK
jgi:hypothetical protein